MPLYFAYGLNMDRQGMARRCPGARAMGVARLPRHRFAIAAEGFATVVRDPRRTVHGVLWDCRLSDMTALDRFERLSTGLYAKISQPVVLDGAPRRALLYVATAVVQGKPAPTYLQAVLFAARDWGLPDDYLHEIEHGEPVPRRPGTPLFRSPV
jgi:gamma-glutamylcyclotransferase (GGCT)/AIG2-like uncharacterized protein YtfP